jgi:hypothetical protein
MEILAGHRRYESRKASWKRQIRIETGRKGALGSKKRTRRGNPW